MKTVVVVEDSAYMRSLIKMTLSKAGYNVVGEAADGKTALKLCYRHKPDIVTLDNILPDMFGVEILQELKKAQLQSKIIMVSAVGQESIIQKVKKLGASGYIIKPFQPEVLVSALNKIVRLRVAV